MKTFEKNKKEMYFAGITARTTNQDEMSGKGKIQQVWEKFYTDKSSKNIKNRASMSIYGVYYDFESDHTGPYNFLLGYKVKNLNDIPDGFTGITIPASKYSVIKTEKGKLSEVVIDAWKFVWDKYPASEKNNRRYSADFEEYGLAALNPEKGRAKLYISVE